MKHIPSLDAAKLLASLAVVFMHAKVPGTSVLLPLCKLAVPLFFLISGFCLMNDEGEIRHESIRRSIFRILKITIVANIIYFLWYLLLAAFGGILYEPLQVLLHSRFWTNFIYYGGNISGHLWYLMAYLQVLVFFYLFGRSDKVLHCTYWFIGVGLILNLILGNYSFLFGMHNSFHTSRNFFTIALPCVSAGMLMRKNQTLIGSKISGWGSRRWLMTVIACFSFLYAESLFYKLYCPEHTADVWLFTVPTAMLLLQTCILFPRWGSGRLSIWGSRWSLYIYIFHVLVLDLINFCIK